MKEHEEEQLEMWQNQREYEKIIHYIDLLKAPDYDHLARKVTALSCLKRFEEALDLLDQMYPEGEDDPVWYFRYGYALACLDQHEEAERMLFRAVKLDPFFLDAWQMISVLYTDYFENEVNGHDIIDIEYQDFVPHQHFNEDYQILADFIWDDTLQRQAVIQDFEKFIQALETLISYNGQIPMLVIALAETIKKSIATHNQENDGASAEFVSEMAYILKWFGVDELLLKTLLYVFSYTLVTDTQDPEEIKPIHLVELVELMDAHDHQAIVDFFFALTPEQQNYAYAEWLIQAFIHLKEYDQAKHYLEVYRQQGEAEAYWHYWYGLALANQRCFAQAEKHLLEAVDIEKSHAQAWEVLEHIYWHGFKNEEMTQWAKEQRELHCKKRGEE